MKSKTILVTGTAGFIGFHLTMKLVKIGHKVIGIDNINDYYETKLKFDRLKQLGFKKPQVQKFNQICKSDKFNENLIFVRTNLEDESNLKKLFQKFNFDIVCNLAAQAGVRYSISNPKAYVDSNIVGFLNILECCRHFSVKKLVYASSSSVYGMSEKIPFNENLQIDKPVSLYAASKKSNELMAYT